MTNRAKRKKNNFKRILIVRSDRIGDVVLSTPVMKAMRTAYPAAHIAVMASPYTKEIVEDSPYVDEVIIFDKAKEHRGMAASVKFALYLRKKHFDVALILNPSNRVHVLMFFSAIPRRVGFDRKWGFLLTDRIKHTKQNGEKHEIEYCLDFVRYLGIEPNDRIPFMPIKNESEVWAEELFRQERISKKDKLLAIHPSASCPSRIWPSERFAQVANRLIQKHGLKVIVVAGPHDACRAEKVAKNIHGQVLNLAGKTSLSQLASVAKRCLLFISSDSGPAHIASAAGVPVLCLFGRSQRGLSPRRWMTVGTRDRFLHKNVGCAECLAHNCKKDFACLKEITVEDVVTAAEEILKGAQ